MGRKLADIWKNRKQILEGITNTVLKKDYIEKIAEERFVICKTCDYFRPDGQGCFVPGTPGCGECGCKLSFKTRSLASHCSHPGGSRWSAVLEQSEEDKLYDEIDYNPDSK
jgi:hypothetical protein